MGVYGQDFSIPGGFLLQLLEWKKAEAAERPRGSGGAGVCVSHSGVSQDAGGPWRCHFLSRIICGGF